METDHERIEELLAGHVLRSLSGEDERRVDHLLAQHVPGCVACRAMLADLEAVTGELALGADPVPPPEPLLPRLHREMGTVERRRRPGTVAAAAASIVVVVGMAGLAVGQGIRASNADERRLLMGEALQVASRPDATQVSLDAVEASGTDVTEITAPGIEVVYLLCEDVASPAPGMIYRVWYGFGDAYRFVEEFEPDPDLDVLRLRFDPATVDHIVITEEPIDRAPTQPVESAIRWSDAA